MPLAHLAGTVEERVQRRAEAKLYLDQMVNRGSTQVAEEMEGMGQAELLSMLKFGADRCARSRAGARGEGHKAWAWAWAMDAQRSAAAGGAVGPGCGPARWP
jgi:hypothetical protein